MTEANIIKYDRNEVEVSDFIDENIYLLTHAYKIILTYIGY